MSPRSPESVWNSPGWNWRQCWGQTWSHWSQKPKPSTPRLGRCPKKKRRRRRRRRRRRPYEKDSRLKTKEKKKTAISGDLLVLPPSLDSVLQPLAASPQVYQLQISRRCQERNLLVASIRLRRLGTRLRLFWPIHAPGKPGNFIWLAWRGVRKGDRKWYHLPKRFLNPWKHLFAPFEVSPVIFLSKKMCGSCLAVFCSSSTSLDIWHTCRHWSASLAFLACSSLGWRQSGNPFHTFEKKETNSEKQEIME